MNCPEQSSGVPLREAILIPPLDRGEVIAGREGLEREVTYISVMEVPDYLDMARAGELLLTTCYSLRNKPKHLAEFVPRAHERGLSGLVVKPRYLDPIPDIMLEEANRLRFPLLKFPIDIPFDDVIIPILTRVLNEKAYLLNFSVEMHHRFSRIVLQGGDLQRILATLAFLCQNPVLMVDLEGYPLARAPLAGMDEFFAEYLAEGTEGPRLKKPICQLLDKIEHKPLSDLEPTSIQIPLGGKQALLYPIGLEHDTLGYLLVWEHNRSFRLEDLQTFEQATIISALELIKQKSIRQVERRYLIDFVHDLLTGQISESEIILQRAQAVGWDLEGPHAVMFLDIDHFHHFYIEDNPNNRLVAILEELERTTEQISRILNKRSKVCRISDSVVMFWPVNLDRGQEHVKQWTIKIGRQLIQNINQSLEHISVSMGIGRAQLDPSGLYRSWLQAKEALEIGRQIHDGGHMWHFDELGIYRILTNLRESAEIKRFRKEILGGLLSYDEERGSDLVHTLETYFENNQEMSRTADHLHIHYNTLRYRLRRIEEIVGSFRDDPWLRLSIHMALRLHRMSTERP